MSLLELPAASGEWLNSRDHCKRKCQRTRQRGSMAAWQHGSMATRPATYKIHDVFRSLRRLVVKVQTRNPHNRKMRICGLSFCCCNS